MELTKEQNDIIKSEGNIKINAVAGSGKTTTIVEYARTRPNGSRILYLAYNKSVKLEAMQKFKDKGLDNVKVETAHSLAFNYIIKNSKLKVRPQAYKTHEIAEILGLQGNGEKHFEYILANHINKFITYFCNSDKLRVQDLNYLSVVSDKKARAFVAASYGYIESQTRLLLSKMDKGEIEVIHDFYLKKFQLSNPRLPYDYILFDEGQDASATMLDIFLKQSAIKVIVGDTHQQIYGWRHAVNSLEKADFQTYQLSTSFRFSQDIANLATEILQRKNHLTDYKPVIITGKGTSNDIKTKVVLARTNLGLLLKAIEYIREQKKIKSIYFEGNISSYTYADDGASLYDVLSLYNGNYEMIKDKLIKGMNDLEELEDYIEKTDDLQLSMMVEIVKSYGNDIPKIIKSIKEKHVENDQKGKADMIFSTVHKSKGMEYDSVQLVEDFLTEEKLERYIHEFKEDEIMLSKLNEEINLLYVAVTRTKNSIYIPEKLMPIEFTASKQIHIIKDKPEAESKDNVVIKTRIINKLTEGPGNGKTYSVENIRTKYKDAYRPWTVELDDELTIMYCEGVNIKDMAKHFGRTKGAIFSRIRKLELEELYG
jgi:superfamily I DNA/RNA helicase